jgi:hypothetical protein
MLGAWGGLATPKPADLGAAEPPPVAYGGGSAAPWAKHPKTKF